MIKIEELILFEEIEDTKKEKIKEIDEINEIDDIEDHDIIINGNVTIEIHNHETTDSIQKLVKKKTKKIRNATVTPAWKNKIKNRDENKCQCCGKTFLQHLEVHHVMPISKYNKLGADDGNGIALCQKCHQKYHDMYRENENAVTFAKFLRDYGTKI